MIQLYKSRSGVEGGNRDQLSGTASNTRARGSQVKFKWCRFKVNKGRWFFTHCAVKLWSSSTRDVGAKNVCVFKGRLEMLMKKKSIKGYKLQKHFLLGQVVPEPPCIQAWKNRLGKDYFFLAVFLSCPVDLSLTTVKARILGEIALCSELV